MTMDRAPIRRQSILVSAGVALLVLAGLPPLGFAGAAHAQGGSPGGDSSGAVAASQPGGQVAGLLDQNPQGGAALANAIAALLVNDPAAANAVLNAMNTANAQQVAALASGFNTAQTTLTTTNPPGAQVLASARTEASTVVAAALTVAANPGGGGGGANVNTASSLGIATPTATTR